MSVFIQMPSRWVELEDKRTLLITHSVLMYKVSTFYGVTIEQMISRSRKKEFVHARHMCWYLLRKHTTLSLQNIADKFERNHTSVLDSAEKIRQYIKIYPAIAYEEKLLSSIILN